MAGSISLSLSQQFDSLGKPLSGGRLFFYQAGTVATPQNAFQDATLTIPYPNPIELDSAGRVPQFYLADGQIKIRLTNMDGVDQVVADNILVIGPSSGGGGGGGIDPTTVLSTGDMKIVYGTGTLSGFVRANGRTIGSSTSGASERANADCQALFVYLWGADPNLAISGGRGVSGAADWTANKTLALPDLRGRVIAGLDDMGNASAGRLSTTYFGAPTILGAAGGAESLALNIAHMPSHFHTATIYDPSHSHGINTNTPNFGVTSAQSGGPIFGFTGTSATINYAGTGVRVNSANGLDTTNSAGSGVAHRTMQPTMVMTIYVKI